MENRKRKDWKRARALLMGHYYDTKLCSLSVLINLGVRLVFGLNITNMKLKSYSLHLLEKDQDREGKTAKKDVKKFTSVDNMHQMKGSSNKMCLIKLANDTFSRKKITTVSDIPVKMHSNSN